MTRAYTQNPSVLSYEIKQKPSQINYCRYPLFGISLLAFVALAYFIAKPPPDYLDDPGDQCAIRNIPRVYSKLETIDPDERDVFQGFRTSFLPAEEIVLARNRREAEGKNNDVFEGNETSDIMIWRTAKQDVEPTRIKRMSHFTFTSHGGAKGNRHPRNVKQREVVQDYYEEGAPEETDVYTETNEYDSSYEEDEDLQRAIRPEPHVDRGPLDDVVEQIRGQPELEEEEIVSAPYVYKTGTSFTGIHAFWKGQGDRDTIRLTQANIMKKYMDAEADPCHDFYQYACGNWPSLNPIPADKAGYDTFEILRENLDVVLKDLLEFKCNEHVPSVYPGKHLQLDEDFWELVSHVEPQTTGVYTQINIEEILKDVTTEDYSYPDEDDKKLSKRGHQPLLDLINLLGGWPMLNPSWDSSKFDWLELMAKLRLYNNDILISEWVGPDIKNSDEFVIQFDQTSLGLPTREYFLQDSNKVYLNAYKTYLIKIAMLLGGNKAHVHASADQLIEFEIKLANITSAPEDRRNVSELYRRMPLKKLEKLVPQVKWQRYLSVVMNRQVGLNETIVMFALTYVRHLVKLIDETDPSILSNYLLWRFVRHRVNNLDDRFQSAKQQFYFVLFGREQAPPRWKNCISQVNSNMGMALGSMFVKKYFDETSKNDTLRMTTEIQQSFKELLYMTEWIDDNTKKLAQHKVEAMMLRIGYPDFILHKQELDDRYKEVKIHPDKYFENILNILQHLTKMEQSRLGQPVNKTLWNTAPAVVNAYYSRNKNQIMFPAGILQPPFYHRHFPRSLNYGGIGVVIGHEITHGFDDKGRLFDCDGNLHRWWSDSAIEAFHMRAQCLIDQYGQYVVPEVNVKLDGVNTQGENIADNGGVKQAFRAYIEWVEKNGLDGETLPGLNHTHTQLFFLNFAQVWCGAMRPEAMRNKLKTAVHSPGRFRVIGTLSNSHDFAREFRCPPGSPMNPKKKCSVW
ncbi:peptidase family m13 domain-containing protein [Phthorimaea operculella]|nr:peptidase family m13 domain-containing protein [Phthorimaea operculella]